MDKLQKKIEDVLTYKSLDRKKKVAIFGGAFDPIHEGHIKVAKFVLDTSRKFDEVWLMPCWKHMYNKRMESFEHRYEMCKLASLCDERIKVSNFELEEKLAGGTYHMVKSLLSKNFEKNDYQFSFIIGLDNANSFDQWVNSEYLIKMISFVVIPRVGEKINEGISWYKSEPHMFLYPQNNELIKVSSTEIRSQIKDDKKPNHLSLKVWRYIKENGLYK